MIWKTHQRRNNNIYVFVGPPKELKKNYAWSTDKDNNLPAALMLCFTDIFQLLVEQTNL
jgi:hypothetical protein